MSTPRDLRISPCALILFIGVMTSAILTAPASAGLVYSTFIGGSYGEQVLDVELDPDGNVVILGHSLHSGFPTSPGAFQLTGGGYDSAIIAKLSPDLSTRLAATYLGTSACDSDPMTEPRDMTVGLDGSVVLVGWTWCNTFPTTPDGWYPTHMGLTDGFVTKLSADLSMLLFGSFTGDPNNYTEDGVNAVAVDSEGYYYLAGYTGYSGTGDWIWIIRYAPDLLTFTGYDAAYMLFMPLALAVDPADDSLFVVGETDDPAYAATAGAWDETYNGNEDFVIRSYDQDMNLQASTFLGGPGYEGRYYDWDGLRQPGLAVSDSGRLFMAGYTDSASFPVTADAYDTSHNGGDDGFVLVMNDGLTKLITSSFLGGNSTDTLQGIALSDRGTVLLAGHSESDDFPVTAGAFDTEPDTALGDGVLVEMTTDLERLWYGTFYGGSSSDQFTGLTLDSEGRLVAVGNTWSSDFPVTAGAWDETYNGSTDFMAVVFDIRVPTVDAALSCLPGAGTVPFSTQMTATLTNLYSGLTRTIAARIDVRRGDGAVYSNWKSGYTNVPAGSDEVITWSQDIPALGSVIGDNIFTLIAEDVTPSPYNQPPHPPSGDAAGESCTVTGYAP